MTRGRRTVTIECGTCGHRRRLHVRNRTGFPHDQLASLAAPAAALIGWEVLHLPGRQAPLLKCDHCIELEEAT